MISKEQKERLKYIREAILCILAGTLTGIFVYGIFLFLHLAIFGWNLGLIFAPLIAGYVETALANKIIGEDIGAISAFILFAYTTFYSFILKNPTLGFNLITIGSMAVILQAAFPTLVNYILVVVVLGTISYILGIFKRITHKFKRRIQNDLEISPETVETIMVFDEDASNKRINKNDFVYMTSTDLIDSKYDNLGVFTSTTLIEIDKHLVHTDPVKIAKEKLYMLKEGKDESILKLAEKIKSHGGNGVVDLEIQYGLIGLGGDRVQINATGIGVNMEIY